MKMMLQNWYRYFASLKDHKSKKFKASNDCQFNWFAKYERVQESNQS